VLREALGFPTLSRDPITLWSQSMDPKYKQMTDYLVGLGTESVPHSGERGFLAHLIGVFRDLENWGCDQDICRAGMFHSIYGTELFQKFALPLDRREEVQELIGKRAEYLGFLNCLMDRKPFDQDVFDGTSTRFVNRITKEETQLDQRVFDDLCTIHVCDWLEQVPHSNNWDYRRDAYRQMAERLGGIALDSYVKVFS
jgi:hypothetical protein